MYHQAYGCICYQRVGMSCFIKSSSVMVTFRSPRPRPSEMCLLNKENDSLSPPMTKHRKRQYKVVWMGQELHPHSNVAVVSHGLFFCFSLWLWPCKGRTYLMSTERRRWISRVPFPHYCLCQPKRYCAW